MSEKLSRMIASAKQWKDESPQRFWAAVLGVGAVVLFTYAIATDEGPAGKTQLAVNSAPTHVVAQAPSAAPVPETTAPQAYAQVEMRTGQSIENLAKRFYGDARRTKAIEEANKGSDFKPGSVVRVPLPR